LVPERAMRAISVAVAIAQLDGRPVIISGSGLNIRTWDLTARAWF
jgi:hypothetical protein